MQKKIYITVVLSFFLVLIVSAQQFNQDHLSFDDAIEYALQNAPKLRIQELKTEQEKERLTQIKREYIPEVYVSSDLRRNIIIPTTPIPAFMINPDASQDELMYMRFNTPWSAATGVNMTFDIFNPKTAGRQSEQKKELAISNIDTQLTKNELRAEVAQAYIDCIIADEQLNSLASDTLYFFSRLQEQQKLFSKGKIDNVEKNEAIINYNNALERYMRGKSISYDARLNLLLVMGHDGNSSPENNLVLTDNIESLYRNLIVERNFNKVSSLTESKMIEQIGLVQLKTQHEKLKYLPTLSLTGYYGANYFGRNINLTESNKWFGNSFLALSLQIPITRSLSTAKGVTQFKLRELVEQENLRTYQNNFTNSLLRDMNDFENLVQSYRLKLSNMELQTQNLSSRQAEYDLGHITDSQLLNEKLNEQQIRQDFLQASYEVLSAYIRLEKLMNQ